MRPHPGSVHNSEDLVLHILGGVPEPPPFRPVLPMRLTALRPVAGTYSRKARVLLGIQVLRAAAGCGPIDGDSPGLSGMNPRAHSN